MVCARRRGVVLHTRPDSGQRLRRLCGPGEGSGHFPAGNAVHGRDRVGAAGQGGADRRGPVGKHTAGGRVRRRAVVGAPDAHGRRAGSRDAHREDAQMGSLFPVAFRGGHVLGGRDGLLVGGTPTRLTDRDLGPDRLIRGIEALQKFGFTYDILVYPIHLEVAYLFASRFPEQPFVVDHLAKPYIKQQEIEPWASQMRKLASLPHVYCKLSGMVTEADWKHWHSRDFKPYTEVILEAFGAERVMIGSDWPVCLLAGNYGRVIDLGEELISALNPTDRTKIMGGNAARFYNLLP